MDDALDLGIAAGNCPFRFGDKRMNFRTTAYKLTLRALLVYAIPGAALALDAPEKTASSSGLTVAISKVSLNQRQLVLQFTVKNNTKGRAYILDAMNDRKQFGFLGSGEQVGQPKQRGIDECQANLDICTLPAHSSDLGKFSYIEPGGVTAFGLTWVAQTAVSDKDTFSFTVPIIARFSAEDGDPAQAGNPKQIQFNFPYVHLDRDN
jgi:hypothetical protein